MRSDDDSPEDRANYARLMAFVHAEMEGHNISPEKMLKLLGMAWTAMAIDASDLKFIESIIQRFIEDRRDDSGG